MTLSVWARPKMVNTEGEELVVRSPPGEMVPCRLVGIIVVDEYGLLRPVLEVDKDYEERNKQHG